MRLIVKHQHNDKLMYFYGIAAGGPVWDAYPPEHEVSVEDINRSLNLGFDRHWVPEVIDES